MGALRWMFAVLATLCCSQWALANAKGFLEKAVPLNVIATTPTDLMTTEEPLIFSGAATITVVFSRSVIALGSDFGGKDLPENLVPFFISQPELAVGRFRWVTTSIARWDPVNSWPPDARVTLQWNRDLKTYGDSSEVLDWDAEATLPIGIPFDITTPDVEIHTPPLTMFVHGVASDMAMDLTDNHWEASTGLKDDLLPEMPPDGKIVMEFSFPVELAAVEKAIKIVEVRDDVRKATEFRAKVSKCQSLRYSAAKLESNSNDEATCLTVSIKDGVLERGVKYEAIFPQGLRYNAKAGALTKEISFHFYGLRNFRIPFHPKIDIGGMTLRMWLPHGLASGTSVNDLKGAFSLTENSKNEEMPFEMSLESKGVMTLTAQFKPGAEYKISVNGDPNIRDGFGLPLESTAANILAEEANPYIAFFQSVINSMDGWDGNYPVVSLLASGFSYALEAKMIHPQTIDEALTLGFAYFHRRQDLTHTDLEIPIGETSTPRLVNVDLAPLLQQSGMIYLPIKRTGKEEHLYVIGYDNENKIVQTDYQMVHMVWFAKGVRKVTLYLTRISDGKPYSDAALVAMRRKDDDELDYYDEDKLEHVKTFTTDAGGMVEFSPPPCVMATWRCSDYVYWVRKEKTNNMFSAYMSPTNPQERIELAGRLVLDRKVVEPGDELKIGGFLTQREGSSVLPFREAKHLQISTWLEGRRRAFGAFIDPQYGTFTATVKIPKDVDPGEYRLSIELEGPKFDLYLSQSYVIGRPRVPTATLTLITPPWVKPNATFEVEVQASSLLGPFVADAEMTLEWKVQGNYGKEFDENVEILRTNSTGGLSYTIDLANLTRPAVTGEMVEISVTWIGPTRERIRERATLRIQPTNMAVKLHRSLSTDLPNIEFGGWVSVTRTTEIGVIPLEGFPVSLELLSFPDSVDISDENEIRAQLSDPTHDGNFPVKLEKKCTALAGVPESQIKCRFQLPKMGHYGFRACAFDSIEDYTACSVDLLGKTLEEFTENPVTEGIQMNFYSLSGEIDPSTMQAQIWVDVPFENSSLFVAWGNYEGVEKKVMPFPEKGMQKVELDGNLCIGSCDVDLYLAVPQQKADFVKGVPFSLHRGPSMPQQFKERKSFTIANETVPFTLNITAGISSSDGSEATPLPGIGPENPAIEEPVALTPGENVTISFHVRRCPGDPSDPQTIACPALEEALSSELLVMVVNKAYLELMDNPLVDLAKELMTKIRTDMSSRTFPESDSWMDPNAYAEARDLFLERIKKDPWLARRMVDYSGNVRRYLNRPDEYFSKEDVQDGTIGPLYNSQFEQLWEALGRIPHKNRLPLTGPSSRSPTEASGSSDQTVEPKLRLKENFKVTPIFKTIRVDPDTGYGTVDFTAPDSLGTFSVRAYASSDLAQRGSFESEIVVRLPLSLTSSAPRFVRIGDEFEAGVVVTINKKDKEGVPVVVTLLSDPEKARNIEYQPGDGSPQFLKNCEDPSDLSCLVELDKKQIKTDVDGQVEVRFKFKAARLGVADLTIRADIAGASDALKVLIPVHGQQKQVQIATSFALKGKLEKPTPSIRNVTTPLPVEMKTYYSSQPAPPPATSAVVVNHAPNPQFGGGALKNKHGEEELGGDMLSQPPPVASIAFVKKGVVLDGRTSEGSLDSGTGSADAGVMDAMKNAANSKKSANFGRKLRQSVGVRLTTASDFGKKNPPVGDAAVSKREKLSVNAESDGDKVNAYQKIVDSESITTKAPVMWTSSDTTSDQVSTDTPLGGQIGFVKKIDTLSSGGHRDYKTGAVEPIQKHKQPAESTQKVGNEPDASPLLRIPGSPSATPPLQKPMSAPDSGGSPVTNSGGTTERGFKKIKKVALGLYGVHGKSSKNRRKGWVDVLHQSIENVEWDEGLKFPDAEPGSGFLGLLAGVGRFPSVLHGVRTTITNWSPLRDWISVYDALANITTPFVLQQYDTEDPKAADHPTYVKAVHAFNISMKNLDALTTEDCGLKSSDYDLGCEETRDINFYSNSWGTWIAANVLEKTKTASNESLKEGVEKLKTLSKLWQKKLVEKVKDIAMWDWNKYGAHLGVYYAVEIRFDLGVDWAPPDDFPEHIKSDLSMDRLSESLQKDELSMEARAKVALAWLKKLGKVEGSKHADVVDSVTAFRNSIRTIGRTAYIARSPQTAAPLDHKTQALILLVFIRSGESGPLIEKLANFVATPSRWYNSEATIFGNLALTAYDEAAGSTEPDLDLTAKSGDITLLQGSFTSPSDPMLSNSTSFDSLSDPPEPLMFKVEGKGEATIVATLDFTPAQLLPFPSYRGIYVERIIQISGADGNPTGPPLKAVPLGKPVVFSIQVTSPDQLGSVSLTVMMPGGIEPIDPLVEKDAQMTCDVGRLGIEISWWRWNLCPAQRTTPEEVAFHYSALMAGTSTIKFQAIAASVGHWVLPPVYAVFDKQPEVMGMSSAGGFTICDSNLPGCQAVPLKEQVLPKECPDDCSGVGDCDLNTGQCNCEAGFTGENCGELQDG